MTEQAELLQRISCKSSTLRGMDGAGLCGRTLLWRSVILRAFQDAGWDLSGAATAMNYRDAHNSRASALLWLRGYSKDFRDVCDLAKCIPGLVRDAARTMFGDAIDDLQIPIDLHDARSVLAARGAES